MRCPWMEKKAVILAAVAMVAGSPMAAPLGAVPTNVVDIQSTLWKSGEGGYHTYRIPALVVTPSGVLLAFCEGRKTSPRDFGDIDLLLRRSFDHGVTWSPQQVVWSEARNGCGNPCPIIDHETGTVLLLIGWSGNNDQQKFILNGTSRYPRRLFVTSSSDDGVTWVAPREITKDVKDPRWTWFTAGPGAGIQIERGPYAGRLVAPCDHYEGAKDRYSHVMFSDDHGMTWKLGGRTPREGVNECQAVELANGRLMLNMRNYDAAQKCRQTAISDDGGMTWHDQKFEPVLIEPICQASLRAAGWNPDGTRKHLLFSNPASTKDRVNVTLRASFDEGRSWPFAHILHAGPGGYSDLCVLRDGRIGCLFEAGEQDYREGIVFIALGEEVIGSLKRSVLAQP
jgi:sialidase-1